MQPAVRLLGAITWQYFEHKDLEAINALLSTEASRNLPKYNGPPLTRAALAVRDARWKNDTLVHLRYWMSDEKRRNEKDYYHSIAKRLEKATSSQTVAAAILIPSFEGILYACNQLALQLLRDELKSELLIPLPGEPEEVQKSRFEFIDGVGLSKLWKLGIDLSLLTETKATVDSEWALRVFRDSIKAQQDRFNPRIDKTTRGYWRRLLRSAPDFPPFKTLIDRIDDTSPSQVPKEQLFDLEDEYLIDFQNNHKENTFPLRHQLERMGILDYPQQEIESELLVVTKSEVTMQLDTGGFHLIAMAKRLETFWVTEHGSVVSLVKTGEEVKAEEKAADGTWKRRFEKYLSQVSAFG